MKLFCAILLALSAAVAQTDKWSEIRELTLASTGALDAETPLGNIAVQGWDKDFVLVRATVTHPLVQINISSQRIWVTGPSGESWSASYEIFVPNRTDLRAHTNLGNLEIAGVAGTLSLATNLGSIVLTNLAGDVSASTNLGAIAAGLTGPAWDGKGLSLSTNSGAIRITAPAAYAARFDLRTNMGKITTDVPGAAVTSTSFFGRKLLFGNGDALIRATASMGAIELKVQ